MTAGLSNGAVAELLDRHGRLLEVAGESPFRARAFTRAAEALRQYPELVAAVASQGRLRGIPGICEGIASAIEQILDTGTFTAHVEVTNRVPDSLVELTAVPDVGAKTALRLFRELGIDSLASLEAAVMSGSVRQAKGLRARVESTIRSGIEALQRRTGRMPIGAALPIARSVVDAFIKVRPQDVMSLAGSARRWEVTIGVLDFVVGSAEREETIAALATLPIVNSTERRANTALRVVLTSGLEADVYLTEPSAWGSTLVRATGSTLHLERLGELPETATTEAEVYAFQALHGFPRNSAPAMKNSSVGRRSPES